MAHTWWAESKRNRRLKSLYSHCFAHEGEGLIAELLLVMQFAIRVAIHDMLNILLKRLAK